MMLNIFHVCIFSFLRITYSFQIPIMSLNLRSLIFKILYVLDISLLSEEQLARISFHSVISFDVQKSFSKMRS